MLGAWRVPPAAMRAKNGAMKVLVTGASGFLGSHIAEQLSREGHTVRALVRKSSKRDFLERLGNVEFAYGGVEDVAAVAEAVKGVDAIIHSAGLVKARNAAEFRKTNVEGTRNLIEAAKKNAPKLQRFVFVSSLAAVGPSHDGRPVEGTAGTNPVTHYGRSKREAEDVVLAARGELPVVVLRPGAIYGPRDNEIFAFFQSVHRGVLPTVGKGDSTISMIYGADCAAACIKAIVAEHCRADRSYFRRRRAPVRFPHDGWKPSRPRWGKKAFFALLNLPIAGDLVGRVLEQTHFTAR